MEVSYNEQGRYTGYASLDFSIEEYAGMTDEEIEMEIQDTLMNHTLYDHDCYDYEYPELEAFIEKVREYEKKSATH